MSTGLRQLGIGSCNIIQQICTCQHSAASSHFIRAVISRCIPMQDSAAGLLKGSREHA